MYNQPFWKVLSLKTLHIAGFEHRIFCFLSRRDDHNATPQGSNFVIGYIGYIVFVHRFSCSPRKLKFFVNPMNLVSLENVDLCHGPVMEYFTDVWDLLRQFGTFWVHLVHFSPVLVSCLRKIWQPCYSQQKQTEIHSFLKFSGPTWNDLQSLQTMYNPLPVLPRSFIVVYVNKLLLCM
jgi:hypothetical protein